MKYPATAHSASKQQSRTNDSQPGWVLHAGCPGLAARSRYSGWAVTSFWKHSLCHFLSAHCLQGFSLSSLKEMYTPTLLTFPFIFCFLTSCTPGPC